MALFTSYSQTTRRTSYRRRSTRYYTLAAILAARAGLKGGGR